MSAVRYRKQEFNFYMNETLTKNNGNLLSSNFVTPGVDKNLSAVLDVEMIGDGSTREEKGGTILAQPTPLALKLLRIFLYIVLFVVASAVLILILHNTGPLKPRKGHSTSTLDHFSATLGLQERVHAVVLDAGSTGSRVLAFSFLKNRADNTLRLDNELWHEVKPGLSAYADDPKQGARSLLPLLELARKRVRSEYHATTPLVLKATAGLRLLPKEKADALLYEVRQVLSDSGFHTTENSVGIMDGKDEGIFSWFTVNYLLDRFTGDPKDSLVALDLGGGSTQITFSPIDSKTLSTSPSDYLTSITLLKQDLDIYTHSYLGLGLMAARKAILTQNLDDDGIIRSPCVNPVITNYQWSYGDVNYTIGGPKSIENENEEENDEIRKDKHTDTQTSTFPMADYADCLKTCLNVIGNQVHKPSELQQREVIAFSYFFDRATDRGMIDRRKGGVVSVQDFVEASVEACNILNIEEPLSCLDLTYISSFLTHGYGLKENGKINLYKRIDNYEVSWALGLAFQIINNGI